MMGKQGCCTVKHLTFAHLQATIQDYFKNTLTSIPALSNPRLQFFYFIHPKYVIHICLALFCFVVHTILSYFLANIEFLGKLKDISGYSQIWAKMSLVHSFNTFSFFFFFGT